MGNTESWQTCQECETPFKFIGVKTEGAKLYCESCTRKNVDILCTHCDGLFQGNLPAGYDPKSKKNAEILCQRCSDKKHEMVCSTCQEPFTVFENHQVASCPKCAKLMREKIKKGKIKQFKFGVNDHVAAICCPRKAANKIQSADDILVKMFNNIPGLPQLQHAEEAGINDHAADPVGGAQQDVNHVDEQLADEPGINNPAGQPAGQPARYRLE